MNTRIALITGFFLLGATPLLARDPERIDVRFVGAGPAPAWSAQKATLGTGFSSSAADGASLAIDSFDADRGHVTYSFRSDALEYDLCGSGPGELRLGEVVLTAGVCVSVPPAKIQSVLGSNGRVSGLAGNAAFVLSVNAYY